LRREISFIIQAFDGTLRLTTEPPKRGEIATPALGRPAVLFTLEHVWTTVPKIYAQTKQEKLVAGKMLMRGTAPFALCPASPSVFSNA